MNTADKMKEIWGGRIPGYIDENHLKKAAVLLPLVEKNGEFHLLFEVRSDRLRSQPGEVCFPGGSIEPGELPESAALRETAEELLIRKEQIEIIAPLDRLIAPANLMVYPFLGRLKEYEDTYSKYEVARIFTVPLSWLLDREPDIYRTRVLTVPEPDFPYEAVPGGRAYVWKEGSYDVMFYEYEGTVIWGMTAKFVYNFIQMYREAAPFI